MKLKLKLVLGFSAALIVFASIIFLIVDIRITGLVHDIFLKNVESGAKLGYGYLDVKYPGEWQINDGKLYKGETCINGNNEIVDEINKETGYLITIFMNETRVATTVLQEDGNRAVGTKASDEIVKRVLTEGKDFSGQAVVAKKNALAYYKPLKDSKGAIVGMWFTGVEKTDTNIELNKTLVYMGICILAMLLLGILDSLFIGHKIASSVNGIRKHLILMSEGNFSKPISEKLLRKKDEVGDAARAAGKMQIEVRKIINNVISEASLIDGLLDNSVSNIYKLNDNLNDISATTEQLSAGMEQTAASMQEMNATSSEIGTAIEGITAKAQKNTEVVKEINNRADSMKTNARISRDNANKIYLDAQAKLKNAIEQNKAIAQIETLSDTILEITTKTNLLSLNAAIEAARAGEAGKGFAVVADEIRKLAADSQNAVGEIQNIIRIVMQSVQNLTESSDDILIFIDSQVIKDYEVLVNTGDEYSSDAESIYKIINDYKTTSEMLLTSISSMLKAINEVTLTTNEGAEGTSNIAQKTMVIVDEGNEIYKLSEETKACSERLKKHVNDFIL